MCPGLPFWFSGDRNYMPDRLPCATPRIGKPCCSAWLKATGRWLRRYGRLKRSTAWFWPGGSRNFEPHQLEQFLADLKALPVEIDTAGVPRVHASIPPVARKYQLSAYDASYLELALVEGLPLATLDKRLRTAARSAGVELFRPAKA